MEPLLRAASNVSALAVSNLISAIWEGTLLAVGVWLCLRLLPRLSAAARSLVWMNAFFLLVLLHVLPALRGHESAAGAMAAPRVELDLRWSLAIGAAWSLLSMWQGIQLIASAVRLRGLARRAIPMEVDAETRALLAAGLGGRAARICTSAEVARPSVLGFFRP